MPMKKQDKLTSDAYIKCVKAYGKINISIGGKGWATDNSMIELFQSV